MATLDDVDSENANEDIYVQLLLRVETLEKRDQQQQAEIDTLRGELDVEKQRTAKIEGRLEQIHMRFANRSEMDVKTASTDRITTADEDTRNEQSEQHETEDWETDDQARSVKSPGQQPPRIRRHVDMPVIAFHATLAPDSLHTGIHQSIVFDNVITNIGAAYNPHVGSFVAPIAGVFVFDTTVMVDIHHVTHVSIVRNGVSVANLYIRGVESAWGSESVMVVLHLDKGDDVMVQNNDADKGINGGHYSMFSGFLLYLDNAGENMVG